MKSRISKILNEIDLKKEELRKEYNVLMDKYDFSFIKWRIVFSNKAKEIYKQKKKSVLNSIFSAKVRDILSMPFIYSMIVPALFLDLFLLIFQNTAIRLYWIPLTKRSDYIVNDRMQLEYLNWIQKINCMYCSYVNGLFSYAVEIGWRTEKYWCPIKHAKKMKSSHAWQKHFADYWDVDWFKECFTSTDEYHKKQDLI